MSTVEELKMTHAQANELVGTQRSGGKVIGVANRPPGSLPEANGVYLIISHPAKKASYERVG